MRTINLYLAIVSATSEKFRLRCKENHSERRIIRTKQTSQETPRSKRKEAENDQVTIFGRTRLVQNRAHETPRGSNYFSIKHLPQTRFISHHKRSISLSKTESTQPRGSTKTKALTQTSDKITGQQKGNDQRPTTNDAAFSKIPLAQIGYLPTTRVKA